MVDDKKQGKDGTIRIEVLDDEEEKKESETKEVVIQSEKKEEKKEEKSLAPPDDDSDMFTIQHEAPDQSTAAQSIISKPKPKVSKDVEANEKPAEAKAPAPVQPVETKKDAEEVKSPAPSAPSRPPRPSGIAISKTEDVKDDVPQSPFKLKKQTLSSISTTGESLIKPSRTFTPVQDKEFESELTKIMQQLASIDKQFNVLQKKKIEDLAAEFHSVDDFLKRRDEWLAQLEPSSLGTEEHREARAAWMQLKKDETDKIHGEAEKIRDWFEEEDDKLEKYLKANPPKKPEVKPVAPVQKP